MLKLDFCVMTSGLVHDESVEIDDQKRSAKFMWSVNSQIRQSIAQSVNQKKGGFHQSDKGVK